MQRSVCPTCHAAIGGESHISAPGNRPATELLERARRVTNR